MQRLTDLRPFEWIEECVARADEPSRPVLVSHALPNVFAACCKLFHPIFVDESIDDPSLTWHDWEKTHGELRRARSSSPALSRILSESTLVRGWPREPVQARRVLWRELAAEHGLQFHPEINDSSFTRRFPGGSWPRRLIGPLEGDFDPDTCARIVEVLSLYTGSHECFFYYWFLATRQCNESLLFKGELFEVMDLFRGTAGDVEGPPTYWWPSDRNWCVCVDWDLTFALIGGPRELVNALIRDETLECLEVSPTCRVDTDSDQLNISSSG